MNSGAKPGRFRSPCVIVNPQAGSGRARKLWPDLRPALERALGPVDARFTEAADHATELASDALARGADLIVAAGGDGTINEVVNGLLRGGAAPPDAALGVVPIGTGGDFRRTAGLPASPLAAVEAIAKGTPRKIDAVRLRLTGSDGAQRERYCINVASFGLGGEVAVAAKNSFLTGINGKAAFLWATTASFLLYQPKAVRLAFDGGPPGEPVSVMEVVIGNGNYNGGGMLPCPLARLDSGHLDVTVIEEVPFFEFLKALPILYSGEVYSHPKCRHVRAQTVTASSDESVRAEVDGESVGGLPLTAEILPGAIRFIGRGAFEPAYGEGA